MQVTPWFVNCKPVRPGVYQRAFVRESKFSDGYSKWNGMTWLAICTEPGLANLAKRESRFQTLPWRGVLKG